MLTLPLLLPLLLQLGSSDELEGKFAQLEGDDVDAELSAMKKGMLGGSKSKQSLPEGRSGGKSEGGRPYKYTTPICIVHNESLGIADLALNTSCCNVLLL